MFILIVIGKIINQMNTTLFLSLSISQYSIIISVEFLLKNNKRSIHVDASLGHNAAGT